MSDQSSQGGPPPLPATGDPDRPADRVGAGAEQGRPARALWRRLVLPLALLVALVVALSVALLGGSSKPSLPGGVQSSAAGSGYLGTLTLPAKPAPAISLHSYLGAPVTLSQYRGKAVLVTFLYTHCPDVCPLIASNLRIAMNELGAQAAKAQIIAVSVDPRGDTRAAVARFLRAHEILGKMQYLVGSSAQLARTWKAWSVGSSREASQPQLVAHSALVYGISASGRLTTIYPPTFEPSQIVHDVPKLAAG